MSLKLLPKISLYGLLAWLCLKTHAQAQSDADYSRYVNKSGHMIQSAAGATYDFSFLKKEVKDKRIVAIGEFNHGSKEIFLLKNKLVKYLHEQLGYDLLLFESGIGEVMYADMARGKLPSKKMTNTLVGPWMNESNDQLMDYVRQKASLTIGGFDVQRSGSAFVQVMNPYFADVLSKTGIDIMSLEKQNHELRKRLLKKEMSTRITAEKERLAVAYKKLVAYIYQNANTVFKEKDKERRLLINVFQNRIAYIDYLYDFVIDGDWNKRWLKRDSIMAENIALYANILYPEKKVLVLAHNFHVSKFNPNEQVMGEYLQEKFGEAYYAFGIYGASGTYADNSRNPKQLAEPDGQNDLKRYIKLQSGEIHFIPIPNKPKAGAAWLFGNTKVTDTFNDLSNTENVQLNRWFDGLIFLKTISPAQYQY